jgi:hypothetical protein
MGNPGVASYRKSLGVFVQPGSPELEKHLFGNNRGKVSNSINVLPTEPGGELQPNVYFTLADKCLRPN